ncbi:uracil-DNA glycosylase [Paraburkholderia caffeinilytica]|uniref:Uracil-DNA glycosylase n=1 Tax=Paraburkholderia caffeinilytica TaxID=1761016 RepID=A0ABQ1MC71_9BURK|nr:uracil-DNA glycosylase [Paraburkholderia caffeinilytica]AXL52300.1 uracil-DNA glycosylase [Paraburkholderia caffeinilytica]GGC36726.1 uracil-DNA glycosylase [Paraburkholderia caffeinilytica]CAB3791460.1 hypothetical protein LMG28690_03283 [Paraburkholderia caffeinilytica]
MNPADFVDAVASIKIKNTFNPYSAVCERFDRKDAGEKRKKLLLELLKNACENGVDSLWIGRDLGYRGGRRTGLALTDEVNMVCHARRWGLSVSQVTKGEPVAERTAAVIWNALNSVSENIFLWNVFPLHPHEEGNSFTNRAHNSMERRLGEEILDTLIETIRPRRLIAVGNDAAASIAKCSYKAEVSQFRHPSYGGQNTFLAQVSALYGVTIQRSKQKELF